MPQQINLCSPTLQKPRQAFEAQTMVVALGMVLVLGGALCALWDWNLRTAGQGYLSAMQAQTQEMQSLQLAIERSKAMAQPPSPALVKEAQDLAADIASKEMILHALQQGNWAPGHGHSDRLALIARSIPAPVWITQIKADSGRMEVAGFTLEPAALNEWAQRLSASPLMKGLRLATVKVQSTSPSNASAAVAGKVPVAGGREAWSFSLVSAQAQPADAKPAGGAP